MKYNFVIPAVGKAGRTQLLEISLQRAMSTCQGVQAPALALALAPILLSCLVGVILEAGE